LHFTLLKPYNKFSLKEGKTMNFAENITELIGKTPLVKINKLSENINCNFFAKLESFNPMGSVKDRICLSMISAGEREGKIRKDTLIVEPTSGNTGVGLSYICAQKGYKLILVMPDTMSIERRTLFKAFGAELFLTPGKEGMKGAIKKAEEICRENENAFMPDQFKNRYNPEIHSKTTAKEILNDLDFKVDVFIAGVGTGGTITGVSQMLKKQNPDCLCVAVEPENSSVISGGKAGSHKIQGIGAGFLPEVFKREFIDEIIRVKDEDAILTARELAKKEGICCGISSGAAMWAALEIAKTKNMEKKNIVVVFPDTGERYLSTSLYS
jgi:cysteine synthase